MKTRFFAIFLPLFFLISALTAEAATFQPNWKIGDTFRYQTNFFYQSAKYGEQIGTDINYKTEFDATITLKYEVTHKSSKYTEFAVSLENIEVRTPEKQYDSDIKLQEFLKKTPLHYQIDPQGKIVKITHLDELIKSYRQEFDRAEKPSDVYENIGIEALINLWINYSNYSLLPLSTYHSPHHSLYMGKDFTLNQAQENPIIISYPPIVPFTLHTIQLEVPGTTSLEKNDTGFKFTSKYRFDKKDTVVWGQIILDRLLLKPEERKNYQEELNEYAQNNPKEFSASLIDTLEVQDFHTLPNHSQSIFEFTASGTAHDSDIPTFYNGKFTMTSTLLK